MQIDIDRMVSEIRAHLENRVRDGYGYGTLAVQIKAHNENSEPFVRTFDCRDYEGISSETLVD